MKNWFKKFLISSGGNIALTASLLFMPLLGASGIALDYAYMSRVQSNLQMAVDSSALATVKELHLVNNDSDTLESIAESYVFSNIPDIATVEDTTVTAQPADDKSELTVSIAHVWQPVIIHYLMENALPLRVSATAKLAGTATICLLGLDENRKKTIHLVKKAKLEAPGCGVYSNSTSKDAISVEDNASLSAGVTCSAGGYKAAKKASFSPDPITDCPRVGDPLAGRKTPSVGVCNETNFEVKSGTHTLYPGTYCKGLKIKGSAEVTLKSGVYIITGDKLEVTDRAKIFGRNVGFYLNGNKAKLAFKKETTIDLTAPKSGLMAGILIFEDRDASSKLQKHEITSDNAGMLLGTIYLPNGTLKIDSEAPIADKAAYTAIIARAIELAEGPTLYLNSDYEATDVPIPEGLVNDKAYLSN